jgi:hypothetical protein
MKINVLGAGKELIELTLTEAYDRADIYSTDSDFEKDCKLAAWLGDRKHRCIKFNAVTYSAELEIAVAEGIEVLIIKESK